MEGDQDWDIVHNQFHRDENNPILPITIYPALTSHTVEVLAFATPIPNTWFSAGRLYHFIDEPTSNPFPKLVETLNVPINQASVYQLKNLTDKYWLQYLPHYWFLEQTVRIRSYRFG